MPVTVACPSCQTALKAPDQLIGKSVKCPKCATVFAVPAPDSTPSSAAGPPPLGDSGVRPPSRPLPQPRLAPALPPPAQQEYFEDLSQTPRRDLASPPSTGLQLGMGITSLMLGILAVLSAIGAAGLAFCCSWFNQFALPVTGITGGLGFLLGVIGLVTAVVKKVGFGFPIAGTATSAVALLAIPIIMFAITSPFEKAAKDFEKGVNKAIDEAKRNQDKWNQPFPDLGNSFAFQFNGPGVQERRIRFNARANVRVNVRGDEPGNLELSVHDLRGKELAADRLEAKNSRQIQFIAPRTEEYIIRVQNHVDGNNTCKVTYEK